MLGSGSELISRGVSFCRSGQGFSNFMNGKIARLCTLPYKPTLFHTIFIGAAARAIRAALPVDATKLGK